MAHPDPAKKYFFVLSQWSNFYSFDYSSWYTDNPQLVSLNTWVDPMGSQKNDMKITDDGRFLIAISKGYGVFVLDISNPSSMFLYQLLTVLGITNQVIVSPKS